MTLFVKFNLHSYAIQFFITLNLPVLGDAVVFLNFMACVLAVKFGGITVGIRGFGLPLRIMLLAYSLA